MGKFREWAIRKLGGATKQEYEIACGRVIYERELKEDLTRKLYEHDRGWEANINKSTKVKAVLQYNDRYYKADGINEEEMKREIRKQLAVTLSKEILKYASVDYDLESPEAFKCASAYIRIFIEDKA